MVKVIYTDVGRFVFRPVNLTSARQIAVWQYPPPYDLYSYDPADVEENVREMLTPHYHYYTVWVEDLARPFADAALRLCRRD